jgi:hypothetical protein
MSTNLDLANRRREPPNLPFSMPEQANPVFFLSTARLTVNKSCPGDLQVLVLEIQAQFTPSLELVQLIFCKYPPASRACFADAPTAKSGLLIVMWGKLHAETRAPSSINTPF